MQSPQVALVTGAGTGIGRACSLALLRAGYNVVLAGRTQRSLDETAELAGPLRSHTLAVATDVRDPCSVHQLFETTEQQFGRLDLLFNNAGLGSPQVPIEEVTLSDWNEVISVNLTGAFLCTQQAFRLMKQQRPRGGRIINNGSIAAHAPRPFSYAYTASKHAMTGLTRATSLDGRPFDIACGQIDIGNATTEMTERMGLASGILQADGKEESEPLMDVSHVADALVYMAKLPLDANVQFMTLMATKMPFVGRG